MEKELDYRGLNCPEPVIRCRAVIDSGHPEKLSVAVDNLAAVENVSRFLSRAGYETASSQKGPSEWVVKAVKRDGAPVESADAAPAAPSHEGPRKTFVLITSETMGRGDDALGARLMENFLATLPELGDCLWRVVLLNGGVKLAASEGPALEQLKKLSASGVGIFVCGTCLMHYGLMEQKQVGETTNMLDIVTGLSLADKIIRP